ncbi:MAG: cupin domain-containing protein [Methyloligellaceae bacterium]
MSEQANGNDLDLRAAHYVLGILPPEARAAFEAELAGDEDLQTAVGYWQDHFQALADAAPPVAPGDAVWDGIEAAVDGQPQPGSLTIRADDGDWLELFDGVFKKTLLIDEQEHMESYLLRIEPGAACPSHSHTKTEECLVMEGEMIIGEARFRAGDYHAAPPKIPHLPIRSETGVLLFVRSELHG